MGIGCRCNAAAVGGFRRAGWDNTTEITRRVPERQSKRPRSSLGGRAIRSRAQCPACQSIDAGALADVCRTFLRFGFRRGLRPHRQLQHGRVLMLRQIRQQNGFTVREFQRVVMSRRLFLVDLAEDRQFCARSSSGRSLLGRRSRPVRRTQARSPAARKSLSSNFSGAAKPRVPVPKFRVVSLSPTWAARDFTF